MALSAYLRIQGQKQGDIKGSVTQKGREGKILVIAVSHEIILPWDPATGQSAGKRQHRPFVITKLIDKSTPLLLNALVNNENLTEWELQFFTAQLKGSGGTGIEINHYTVKLTNAQITDVKSIMPNTKDPALAKFTEYEEIQFIYQKIEWIWTDGNITATDDWTVA